MPDTDTAVLGQVAQTAQTAQTAQPHSQTGGNQTGTLTEQVTAGSLPYRAFNTQQEFDNHAAGIKGNAKREAEKELLSALGLKPEEKDKLAKFKELYDASLTAQEKAENDLKTLKSQVKSLQVALEEKEFTLVAFASVTGKKLDDVSKIVKMAKGLKDDSTTIEQAINTVIEMINAQQPSALQNAKEGETKPGMPKGMPLMQPEIPTEGEKNPFKKETFNLTEQGRLYKEDPAKARKLAAAAGAALT